MKLIDRVQWISVAILCLAFLFIIGTAGYTALFDPRPDLYSGVLIVNSDSGQGSCFVVAERDGWHFAITAHHVTKAAVYFTIDDEAYPAEVVQADADRDIVLIRFKSPERYRVYPISRAEVGESCVTVGWSQGSRLIYRGSIVALNFRDLVAANGGVVPGCSGGVLLNDDGEVIGVTVQVAIYRGSVFDSTALYTPARYVEALMLAGMRD